MKAQDRNLNDFIAGAIPACACHFLTMWNNAATVQPEPRRFVWVRFMQAGKLEISPVLHITQRATLPAPPPHSSAILFYPIDGDGVISEKPNHSVTEFQYAAPHDESVTMLLERITTFERMIYDYETRIAELESKLRGAGVQD